MKELNNKLDGLNELITRIDAKILDINNKLDEVIAALHEYDDDQLHCEYSGLPSVKAYDEVAANERMDIIGQNGNEGTHYNENEFDDYGKRVVVGNPKQTNGEYSDFVDSDWSVKDKSNNPAKHTGETKKRNKRKYYKPK
jgi:hypothetical protein